MAEMTGTQTFIANLFGTAGQTYAQVQAAKRAAAAPAVIPYSASGASVTPVSADVSGKVLMGTKEWAILIGVIAVAGFVLWKFR